MTDVQRRRDDEGAAAAGGAEAAVEALARKAVVGGQTFFLNSIGALPPKVDEARASGRALKRSRTYGTDKDGKPVLRVTAAPSNTPAVNVEKSLKLLTSGKQQPAGQAAAAAGPSDMAKQLPQPSGDGQLVVVGDKEKAKQLEREARKAQALTVLPVSGKDLRSMHQRKTVRPQWHAPWKLHKVISGHAGWVRTIAVDPSNKWFATSGNDRTLKFWDLASGELKLSLAKHIHATRAMKMSARSPYLFTGAEDNEIHCWDLEANKVVRTYHGHLSAVYDIALYEPLELLISGGRDASVRVWDIRTKQAVHTMTGHREAVMSVETMAAPTVVSGSQDNQMRIWDIGEGRCTAVLTHHKKGIRSLAMHPTEYTFCSGAADSIKKWKCPKGEFMMSFAPGDAKERGAQCVVNTISVNTDNVMVSGTDDGLLRFWDWKTGYNFQTMQRPLQSGSLSCESPVYASTFDMSGSRLLTGNADKTICIWKEDETATEETHPIVWNPEQKRRY